MRDSVVSQPREVDRPDIVLRGEEAGDGPTVVLLHAGGERRTVWAPIVERLVAAGLRCVTYDQRGHGESAGRLSALAPCADDIAAVVAADPGCVLVGASLGGLGAIAALADPPTRARVAGLVLVDVVPNLDADRVRRFLGAGGLLDVYPEFIDDVLAQVPRLKRITARLDLPIVLVRGGHRSALTAEEVSGLLDLASQTVVTSVPSAGHLIAREQPEVLAQIIADATPLWPPRTLLRDLGADRIEHPGGNLLDHLERVRELTASLGGGPRVRLAALTHATYGTDGFAHPLLPADERSRLRAAIGHHAEALVYRYDACDRDRTYPHLGTSPLPVADRFTGSVDDLTGRDLVDFALLTIANELDVLRHATLPPDIARGIRSLITEFAKYLPETSAAAVAAHLG